MAQTIGLLKSALVTLGVCAHLRESPSLPGKLFGFPDVIGDEEVVKDGSGPHLKGGGRHIYERNVGV